MPGVFLGAALSLFNPSTFFKVRGRSQVSQLQIAAAQLLLMELLEAPCQDRLYSYKTCKFMVVSIYYLRGGNESQEKPCVDLAEGRAAEYDKH